MSDDETTRAAMLEKYREIAFKTMVEKWIEMRARWLADSDAGPDFNAWLADCAERAAQAMVKRCAP